MANPAAPIRKLARYEGLESLHFDFETQMEQMIAAYIAGLTVARDIA